jgi:UDP-glucose 4-epimerase
MILVTGGAGYIGSHTALTLIDQGFDVVIFDNLGNGHKQIVETLKNIKKNAINFVCGDLRNLNDVDNAFKKYEIDAVMHFAAYIEAGESVVNPCKYYNNNLVGFLNLADKMVENRVDKIVFSSSAAVYGEQNYAPIDERHQQNPINPYGHSKLITEQILSRYDIAYSLKSVSLRYFNVIGADSGIRIGEWHEPETHLIPNILASAENPEKVFQLYGDDYDTKDGTCIRDFVNVEDLAEAHASALRYLINGGNSDCFNLGTATGYTVKEVLATCEKITGKKINMRVNKRRAGDPEILVSDNKKAKNILEWTPNRSLEDSIKTAYEWYKRINIKE